MVDALKEGGTEPGGRQHVDPLLPGGVTLDRRSEGLGESGWSRVRLSFPFLKMSSNLICLG